MDPTETRKITYSNDILQRTVCSHIYAIQSQPRVAYVYKTKGYNSYHTNVVNFYYINDWIDPHISNSSTVNNFR